MKCFSRGLSLLNNLVFKDKANYGQALSVVSLNLNGGSIYRVQIQILQGVCTACTRRAHNALEDPTA